MANLSNLTRKEQILRVLLENKGEWVDGTRLATEEVGGSEGLRRLRELRADGHIVQQRRHPDADRDIWQYRIVDPPPYVSPLRDGAAPPKERTKLVFGEATICYRCHGKGCGLCANRGWT